LKKQTPCLTDDEFKNVQFKESIVIRYNFTMNVRQMHDRARLRTLADFRYSLRQFLQFSEQRAEQAGLHPQQHQLLLQIAGAPAEIETTVSYAAERLGLRHHSVVELSKRCEDAGLLQRVHDAEDRRRVRLDLTAQGHRVLRVLSADHERELRELLPVLVKSLSRIEQARTCAAEHALAKTGEQQ
jgi:DNA-binding MarR family transcriptional regulator